MRLFGSPFSPFARKVALVLDHKQIDYEYVDAGSHAAHDALEKLNPRREVPVLDDGGLAVVNSADIVAHLDYTRPDRPVLPTDPAARVTARAWERLSDTTIDAILADIALWSWAKRPDPMPEGMLDAARRDLDGIFARLEAALAVNEGGDGRAYFVGDGITIADLALFPHLSVAPVLGVPIDAERFPKLTAWLAGMLALPITRTDLERLREYMPHREERGLEMNKIAWRGDRLEWLLSRGFHEWLVGEIEADRVIWPL